MIYRTPFKGIDKYYVYILVITLAGYAIANRGFATINIKGISISELLLAAGLILIVFKRYVKSLFLLPMSIQFWLFIFWGIICTIPYLGTYRINSLRDAVVWGYAVFAVIIFCLVNNLYKASKLFHFYQKFIDFFPYLAFIAKILSEVKYEFLFVFDKSISIIHIKPGQYGTFIFGAVILSVLGFRKKYSILWYMFLIIDIVLVVTSSRASILSIFVPLLLVIFIQKGAATNLVSKWSVAIVILLASSVFILPHLSNVLGREVTFDKFSTKAISIISSDETIDGYGEKKFRLKWWNTIVEYTFFGDYFISGKGYGINLADDDGFQTDKVSHSLRAPHNIFMTYLARSGVTGLFLWIVLLFSWFVLMYNTMVHASLKKDDYTKKILLFLIAYNLSILISACFDPFLESPMGGVWFWVVFGLGLRIITLYRKQGRTNLDASALPLLPEPSSNI